MHFKALFEVLPPEAPPAKQIQISLLENNRLSARLLLVVPWLKGF
jgi:hypothetical protein